MDLELSPDDRDFLAEKVWNNSMFPGYSMVPPGIQGYTSAAATFADKSQIDREDAAEYSKDLELFRAAHEFVKGGGR